MTFDYLFVFLSVTATVEVTNPEPVHGFDGRSQLNELTPLSQSKYKLKLVGGQNRDFMDFRGLVFLLKLNLKLR
jgi:hypothetical protein